MMFSVGKIVVKTAGRDAGKTGVVIDTLDDAFVMIDGQTRRRKCNVAHLELTGASVKIAKNAASEAVAAALKTAGIPVAVKKGPKQKAARPRQVRKAGKKTSPVAESQDATPAKVVAKPVKKAALPKKAGL